MSAPINDVFARRESAVGYYARRMPATFASAKGSLVVDEDGRRYIDFLSACGSLNYGHNHPAMIEAAIGYLARGGLVNGLDLRTTARRAFMEAFERVVLEPRGLDHRIQFTGPTGTNAVEAALKLARKVTGRTSVVAFTNAFHGVSLGALAATGNARARKASLPLLGGVLRLPFEGFEGAGVADLDRFAAAVRDPSGGVEPPAAFIVETVQGEGGLNVASVDWLRRLAEIAERLGALLIVDEVQTGCGRTGDFFSFERAGIVSDIVCLSKSLSGMGLPMAIALVRPDRDLWSPAEHNGTFRGNNLAFVTATAALRLWEDEDFVGGIAERAGIVSRWIAEQAGAFSGHGLEPRGVGLMRGLRFDDPAAADRTAALAFELGVMIETAGPRGEVLKLMPALNIDLALLGDGLGRLSEAIHRALSPDALSLVA